MHLFWIWWQFQIILVRSNKILGKCKTPDWNIPSVNRSVRMEEKSSKGLVLHSTLLKKKKISLCQLRNTSYNSCHIFHSGFIHSNMVRWACTLFVSNFMLYFDTVAKIVPSNPQYNCCHWATVLEPMGNKWHQQGHKKEDCSYFPRIPPNYLDWFIIPFPYWFHFKSVIYVVHASTSMRKGWII